MLSLLNKLKARIAPDELEQLSIDDAEIEIVLSSAAQFVGMYGITNEELILKVAIYNLYLRNTTQMSEALTRDYEATLRSLNALKTKTEQTADAQFTPAFRASAKEDLNGF